VRLKKKSLKDKQKRKKSEDRLRRKNLEGRQKRRKGFRSRGMKDSEKLRSKD
jgi:hypothetical protein